jgi:hypothetical protein
MDCTYIRQAIVLHIVYPSKRRFWVLDLSSLLLLAMMTISQHSSTTISSRRSTGGYAKHTGAKMEKVSLNL